MIRATVNTLAVDLLSRMLQQLVYKSRQAAGYDIPTVQDDLVILRGGGRWSSKRA